MKEVLSTLGNLLNSMTGEQKLVALSLCLIAAIAIIAVRQIGRGK
jgi:hypothetical protein